MNKRHSSTSKTTQAPPPTWPTPGPDTTGPRKAGPGPQMAGPGLRTAGPGPPTAGSGPPTAGQAAGPPQAPTVLPPVTADGVTRSTEATTTVTAKTLPQPRATRTKCTAVQSKWRGTVEEPHRLHRDLCPSLSKITSSLIYEVFNVIILTSLYNNPRYLFIVMQ